MFRRYLVLLFAICGLTLVFVSTAVADSPAPGWEVVGRFGPTNLSPGGQGILYLYVYNVGGATGGPPIVTNVLPAGLVATGGESGGSGVNCSTGRTVVCEMSPIAPGGEPNVLEIPVSVEPGAESSTERLDRVTVAGGSALGVAKASVLAHYGPEKEIGLGFANFDAWLSNADGTMDTQAGSHPYDLTVSYATNSTGIGNGEEAPADGEVHTLEVNLPPGLVGDPSAVPQCTREQFDSGVESGECPADTQIGVDDAAVSGTFPFHFPVYNLVPPAGVPAQFGFVYDGIGIFLDSGVRSGGDGGITTRARIPQREIVFNTTTIWGNPGEHLYPGESSEELAARGLRPLLTLPTSCGAPSEMIPPRFSIEGRGTWQDEQLNTEPVSSEMHNNEGASIGITGCEKLVHFTPTVSLAPETSFSDTPTGLTAFVKVPQGLNPEGLATSGLKETTVTLPEGVVINPGQATGLVACQPSEENIGGPEAEKETMDGPPSCPAASKVGTDEISTPLLANRLRGNVYILQNNPPELKLLVAASGEGVNLKLIGTVHLNEQTGQLTTTFKGTPQDPGTPDAPLTEFVLSFSGGAQAALVTPATCGAYTSSADFTPWASPFVENMLDTSSFQITNGPGGDGTANCTNPLPFAPTMTAGATTDQAAGYTDFTMLLSRGDGQQRIEKLRFKTPEGLLGMIAKVPLCQEPQAAQGTCSTASQIGHTVAEVGPGPYPFVLPEPGAPPAPIYLTGPYAGAPFGLSIAVPIVAGPFNLGTEVVRAKIEVDPHTSQLTISTTAFPKTVKGIPTDIREIDAVIDRPEFMFNPTSCNPMSFSGTAYSFEGATEPLSSHFQVGSCQALKFQPNFKVSTSGKTSRANGASLTAKIVYPVGNLGANQASSQSSIASVKVDLPKQLPSRLTTLQKACTAATFEANPANCPPASIVGHAKAITPVLPVPIEGPTYFVSHADEEFPSLIAVLQGYGVTVDLVGTTFINSKTNITSSTFKNVPDVPIQSFELSLPQGKYSALAANGNLCKTKLAMPTAFTGQNGAVIHQSTPINVTSCPKAKKAKAKAKAKARAKGKRGKKK
jgi:hypothetical protein